MSPNVIVDACSYNYYRVTASLAWFRRAYPDNEHPVDPETGEITGTEFLEYLESQYHKHLAKVQKQVNVLPSQMIAVRDCPIDQIWRRKHYPLYKQRRLNNNDRVSQQGPLIKYLNQTVMNNTYYQVLRVEEAEADDVVSVLTQYYLESTDQDVIIVANDSDYTQLMNTSFHPNAERVKIFNPKTMKWITPNPEILTQKINHGDASDEVPRASNESERRRNRQLVDLSYVPRYIQDRVFQQLKDFKPVNGYMRPLNLQLGLCCMHTKLGNQKPKVYCSRTMIIQTIEKTGLKAISIGRELTDIILAVTKREAEPVYFINPNIFHPETSKYLKDYDQVQLDTIYQTLLQHQSTIRERCLDLIYERAPENCHDLLKMIKYIAEHEGTRVLRISSDLMPHKSNPKVPDYDLEFAKPLLEQAGALARRYKMRLVFHPGQYNVVGTPKPDIFEKTCIDLDWHAEVLDLLGCDQDGTMVVHGGGLYGDKELTIQRWVNQYFELPERVQRRLVLEHCEKNFNVDDCLRVSDLIYQRNGLGIPVVFDTHHYTCYNLMHPDQPMKKTEAEYMPMVLETWNRRHIKPIFHISEQRLGAKIGAHSDLIENPIPDYILAINQPLDLEVEAKLKEQAIARLYQTHPELDPFHEHSEINNINESKVKLVLKLKAKTTEPKMSKPKLVIKMRKPLT